MLTDLLQDRLNRVHVIRVQQDFSLSSFFVLLGFQLSFLGTLIDLRDLHIGVLESFWLQECAMKRCPELQGVSLLERSCHVVLEVFRRTKNSHQARVADDPFVRVVLLC